LTTSQRIAAVNDAYGTGQTNFGLPTKRTLLEVSQDFNTVYSSMAVGATLQNVCSLDDYTSALTGAENKLASRRFVRITIRIPVGTRSPFERERDQRAGGSRRRPAPRQRAKARVGRPCHPSCAISTPTACVETLPRRPLSVGEQCSSSAEWTNTNALDDAEPPIGRTCFDVTVTRP
jgi:hypothetical protein